MKDLTRDDRAHANETASTDKTKTLYSVLVRYFSSPQRLIGQNKQIFLADESSMSFIENALYSLRAPVVQLFLVIWEVFDYEPLENEIWLRFLCQENLRQEFCPRNV